MISTGGVAGPPKATGLIGKVADAIEDEAHKLPAGPNEFISERCAKAAITTVLREMMEGVKDVAWGELIPEDRASQPLSEWAAQYIRTFATQHNIQIGGDDGQRED